MDEKQSKLNREVLLSDNPIYYDVLECSSCDNSQSVYSHLTVNDLLEISIVISGFGNHKILNQIIPCREGDIFIIPSDVSHGYFLSDDSEKMCVRRFLFDPKDWFSGDIAAKGSPRYCYGVFHDNSVVSYAKLNSQTLGEIEHLSQRIIEELCGRKNEWYGSVSAYLSLLLITLGRYVGDAIKNVTESQQNDWRLIGPAINMITERYSDSDFTLEAIAEALFVSQSHLSRVFKHVTGENFSQYLKNVRMKRACELLKDTSLAIDDIVERCGLKDIPTFYQSFHTHIGKTPNQYRTENKNIHIGEKGEKIMVILNDISENLQLGKAKVVKELVQQALDEGADPERILNDGLLAGMNVIGEKFKNNEVYVPQVLVSARAMKMGAEILKPHLVANGVVATGKVCIGTVQGDLHDIGKNLVKMMMEGKGLEVVDLGTDVAPEIFVQTAIEQNCQVICCSALLTTTMPVMEDVVKAAIEAGIRDKVKIMVGGAPVNDEFCQKIGADIYTVDAASAAEVAVAFCKQ